MKRVLITTIVLCAGSAFAVNQWTVKHTTPTWWYDSVTNWTEKVFPTSGEVSMGNWSTGGTRVYLQDGDVVSGLSKLKIAKDWTAGVFTLELRKGASLTTTDMVTAGYDATDTDGRIIVSNATLNAGGGIRIGGGVYNNGTAVRKIGRGRLSVFGSTVSVSGGAMQIGVAEGTPADTVNLGGEIARASFVDSSFTITSWGDFQVGKNADNATYKARVPFDALRSTFVTQFLTINGTADFMIRDSVWLTKPGNWAENACQVVVNSHSSQTNVCVITNSTLVLYRPEWQDDSSTRGKDFGRWRKIRLAGRGYSEFVQDNSIVTNVGVWFWPTQNAGNVYPVKPPKYVVKGGELYVYNSSNYGDMLKGYGNGVAACGFAAATNAPNSGTISLVDAPRISYPRVCTNLLISGQGQDASQRVFGRTDYRPHFEFVLTQKGIRPMEIREQTDILGMYSVVPQSGLQLLATNRLALIRHKTASKTLTTLDEPQFRAPNAGLWTTGGFADTPREWGVTLKPAAEIVSGADQGAGVTNGYVTLPRCNPEKLRTCRLHLKMAPATKTLAEIVADLNAAGYPSTLEGTDEVVVDLLASGMLTKGSANKVILDFTAQQDAVDVRDNVRTANALILKATTEVVGQGLVLVLR